MPTFLARLRLPLLRLFLLELLEVAAITGKAVSASSPKHRTAAHSDLFIDRPSPDKICNHSAKLRGVFNRYGSTSFGTLPVVGQAFNVPLCNPFVPFCSMSITQNLIRLGPGSVHLALGMV